MFKTYVFIVAGNHVSVGDLIADAVARFVGIIGPLSFWSLLYHHPILIDHNGGRRRLHQGNLSSCWSRWKRRVAILRQAGV